MSFRRVLGVLALAGAFTGLTGCGDDITGSDDATIIVQNNASVAVVNLFISPCEDETWGNDELGSGQSISSGDDREFDVEPACYDLRAEFSDDTFAQDFGIDLDDGDEFTWELID